MKNNKIIQESLGGFTIVATFFSLWLAVQFEESAENILAYALILSFGILHGANDLKLIQRSDASKLTGRSFFKTLLYYVFFVLGSALLFYFIPMIALVLFVVFSGYHFGEQHWVAKIKSKNVMTKVFFLFYGLTILFLLFSLHAEMVAVIIGNITSIDIPEVFFLYGAISSASMMIVLSIFVFVKEDGIVVNLIKELFYFGVFYIVFSTASLLWSFAIYFVLWHSIPSLVDQIQYLYGNFSVDTVKRYAKSSFPYWMVSIIGLAILLYVLRDNYETSLSFFFAFLAAITFPHVLVINRINNS